MSQPVLLIDLSARDGECAACGVYLPRPVYGIPMYEGEVLPNDWPGEWGGFDACEPCYRVQCTLTEPRSTTEVAALAGRLG